MVTAPGDPYDLERFVTAQAERGTYERALAELRDGRKHSHWIWFVFPQVQGLGRSATSRRYAVTCLAEARAYLAHPVLGPRLIECATILAESADASATRILGAVDAQKLHSSMTLFHRAEPDRAAFASVLDRFFDGVADPGTDDRLPVS
ncbi:MAG: DUF1810 domain-containing protein [Jatrophihabitantaceae bacterium]